MKINIFKKINNSLGKKSIIIISVLVFLGLSLAAPASADWAITVFGGILKIIIGGVGLILILAIRALVYVAQYSTFLNSGAVTLGWVIVRDLCNMFFVVVLLIIAFGTILNIEKYNYKKWLPKLILMAILINFSKTICGVLIDIAQVVMLTFVNSFSTIGAGTLVNVLGITDILQIAKSGNEDIGFWTVIGAYLLGLAYVIVSLIVVITMISMLAIRIVMIWIYVVLSPLAYLLSAFPGGQSYASKWWTEFTKNLIVGPVLAFFLWLSFAALTADQVRDTQTVDEASREEQEKLLGFDPDKASIETKASSPGALIKFVIAIGMLVGGLKIAQEVGGAAGSMAGKGMAAVNKAGKIGLAGAAAVTGVRAAQGIYKNYGANRKANRERRYRNVANKMTNATANVSEKIKGKVDSVKGNVKEFAYKKFGHSTKEEEARVEKNRLDLQELKQNSGSKELSVKTKKAEYDNVDRGLDKKEDFSADGVSYGYDTLRRGWVNKDTGLSISGVVLSDLKARKKAELDSAESDLETHNNDMEAKKGAIGVDEKAIEEKREKQKKTDMVLKTGAYTLAAVGTIVSGGLGGAALVGAAGASMAINQTVKKHGEDDVAVGSDYRLQGVKKAGEKLGDEDDKTVLATMDDNTASRFTRAAAALEAMRRGLILSDKAKSMKEKIGKELGGFKDGKIIDKKVDSYFESVAAKTYPSATKDFANLDATDPEKARAAKVSIVDKIQKGVLRFDNIDVSGLTKVVEHLMTHLSPKDIKSQYDSIKEPQKKKEVLEAVKAHAVKKAGKPEETKIAEAISGMTDLETASKSFGSSADPNIIMEKLLAKLSFADLKEAFVNGTLSQQRAIVDAIKNSKKGDKMEVVARAAKTLNNGSPQSEALKKDIGL